MDAPFGTLHRVGDRPALRFERRLAHPPEKVWKAITDPAELRHWFPARVEAEPRAGAPMRFVFDGTTIEPLDGEVVEYEPPRLYLYRWGDDLLRWELVPDGDGCRLVFTHTFGQDGTWGGELAAARQAAGWHGCLDLLLARLDGRTADASMAVWFERNERYVERFGLAEGDVHDHPDGFLLRFERDLVQPVEVVWAAMTGQAATPPGAPPVGSAPPASITTGHVPAGPVTAVDPPGSIEYGWLHGGAPAGQVRWELTGLELGCRLMVTQTLPARLADLRAPALAAWQVNLELLVASLHGVPRPWPADREAVLRRRYADRLSTRG